jgi:hypothetical protein
MMALPESQSGRRGRRRVAVGRPLRQLTVEQIELIDRVLCELGQYGEVSLRLRAGLLEAVTSTQSYDAFKWQGETSGGRGPDGKLEA